VSCARTAEPIDLPFGLLTPVGQRMHKFNRIRQVAPMLIETSVYGGDPSYVKLLSLLVIFGHAHLDSRTDCRALRSEYCIVCIPHNTAI